MNIKEISKYIFIINPKAGSKSAESEIRERVRASCEKAATCGGDVIKYDFYTTKAPSDATKFVKSYLECHNERVCFVACGGDGTLNEVCEGVIGHDNACITVYPSGSGNDYVKYYGGSRSFLDPDGLFDGSIRDVDVMRVGNKYSINICNFGFDTTVAKTMQKVRRIPLIGGTNSYYTGIASALCTSMKNKCKIYADSELLNPDGVYLLCTLGNGSYVGGNFNCSPRSDNTDGLIEVCLVSPVSLPRFLKLLPFYEKGTHLSESAFDGIIKYRRAKSVYIESPSGLSVSVDGEIVDVNNITIENIPEKVHFLLPRDAIISPARIPSTV